jgi:hypothetical protein
LFVNSAPVQLDGLFFLNSIFIVLTKNEIPIITKSIAATIKGTQALSPPAWGAIHAMPKEI